MRDLFNNVQPVRALSPAAAITDNTAQVSQITDRRGYNGLLYLINLGGLIDADATFTVLVEHGDAANLSDAVAVPDKELQGLEAQAGFTFNEDNALRKIGYGGSRRYVRITITPANNTGNAFISVVALLHDPHSAPTPNPPA